MFDVYQSIFEQRGDLYNSATTLAPAARSQERNELIDRLRLNVGDLVADVPAGGGYLADGIQERYGGAVQVLCVEPSPTFAKSVSSFHGRLLGNAEALPIADSAIDAIGSLAGLHHHTNLAKQSILDEFARVLRPSGGAAVADVLDDSGPAVF